MPTLLSRKIAFLFSILSRSLWAERRILVHLAGWIRPRLRGEQPSTEDNEKSPMGGPPQTLATWPFAWMKRTSQVPRRLSIFTKSWSVAQNQGKNHKGPSTLFCLIRRPCEVTKIAFKTSNRALPALHHIHHIRAFTAVSLLKCHSSGESPDLGTQNRQKMETQVGDLYSTMVFKVAEFSFWMIKRAPVLNSFIKYTYQKIWSRCWKWKKIGDLYGATYHWERN